MWIDNEVISETLNGISLRVVAYATAVVAIAEVDGAITSVSAKATTPDVARADNERIQAIRDDTALRQYLEGEIEDLEILLK